MNDFSHKFDTKRNNFNVPLCPIVISNHTILARLSKNKKKVHRTHHHHQSQASQQHDHDIIKPQG